MELAKRYWVAIGCYRPSDPQTVGPDFRNKTWHLQSFISIFFDFLRGIRGILPLLIVRLMFDVSPWHSQGVTRCRTRDHRCGTCHPEASASLNTNAFEEIEQERTFLGEAIGNPYRESTWGIYDMDGIYSYESILESTIQQPES